MKESILDQEVKEKNFLSKEGHKSYSVDLMRYFDDVNASIIFSELILTYYLHMMTGTLTLFPEKEGDWFCYTQEDMEVQLVLARKTQDRCINILLKEKLIEIAKTGIPGKRYFRINFDNFYELDSIFCEFVKENLKIMGGK